MTIIELIPDIGKIIVFLLVLLAIFLFTVNSHNKIANKLFATFLLLTAFDMSGFFIIDFFNENIYLNSLKISSVLLQMPVFYLYVQAACYYNFKLQVKHLLHGLLFLIFLLLFLLTNLSEQSFSLFELSTKIQYYAYILSVILSLRRFKKLHQENYSASMHSTYTWLLQTTILFLVGNSFVAIKEVSGYFQHSSSFTFLSLATSLFALFVICWFVLKALYQPKLFTGIDKNLQVSTAILQAPAAHEKELAQLATYMESEKPYLDPELTLKKLADQIQLPEKQVSFLINHQIGKHFFDYINDFRIQDAQLLLRDNRELTVLEILYQVGFNSKSSFYTAFKKVTQQTPTAFRKAHR